MFHTIITHPGQAHRDDFMACAIALGLCRDATIHRREPVLSELDDPKVLVLDIGGRHEPELGNFDHHQLPRDAEAACALSLLAEAMGWSDALSETRWYGNTKVMDSKGPCALAALIGCDPKIVFANPSPVEGALLELFQGMEAIPYYAWLHTAMAEIGHAVLSNAKKLLERRKWLEENARVRFAGVEILVVESTDTDGVSAFRDAEHPDAAICVSHDDRDGGWSLYRFDDDPRVDFSLVAGDSRIKFAHTNGFIAKTKERLGLDEVLGICRNALVLTGGTICPECGSRDPRKSAKACLLCEDTLKSFVEEAEIRVGWDPTP